MSVCRSVGIRGAGGRDFPGTALPLSPHPFTCVGVDKKIKEIIKKRVPIAAHPERNRAKVGNLPLEQEFPQTIALFVRWRRWR